MVATAIAVLFLVVHIICWVFNKLIFRSQKLNSGYLYFGISLALLLNQLRIAADAGAGAEVFGMITGTWTIPMIIGYFIGRKIAREAPNSFPSSLWKKDTGAARQEPSFDKSPSAK